ncbi:MAG: protein kinase [Myxococcales bacterium]|nr:protein kinase [Myxococcales bacterium]
MSSMPGMGPARGPQPFGKYLLDGLIAEGGMARVYRARLRGALGFEKPLVVKLVRPELSRDPRFVAMFAEEAKTLVRLSHPHIVSVYELGVVDGTYFLAMDQVEGATLSELLRDGKLAPPLAARLGEQVAEALHHAHERFGLVHRDVTPRNVLVDREGHARLVDFGIATPAEGASGEVFGSHGYMAPEQLRGEPVDARVDLFALGAVLHQALSGVPAFLPPSAGDGKRPAEIAREAVLAGVVPELPEDVPAPLRALVRECLAHQKEDRPSSAAEVARRLRTWLAAAAPEGAGDELRARVALVAREHDAAEDGPISVTSRKGLATSLATAEILTAALGPEDEARRSSPDLELGTVPLTGRARVGGEAPDDAALDSAAPLDSAALEAPEAPDEVPGPLDNSRGASAPMGRDVEDLAVGDAAALERVRGGTVTDARRANGQMRARVPGRSRWALVAAGAVVALLAVIATLVSSRLLGPPPAPRDVAAEPPPSPPSIEPATEVRGVEPAVESAVVAEVGTEVSEVGAEVAPSRGSLTVHATPWAEVSVDGRSLGTTPIRRVSLAPGNHTLVFENPPLGRTLRVPVRVEAGGNVRVLADLDADPPRARVR